MYFFGENLSDDDCELLALTQLHHTHLEQEAEAMQSKWFDYRLIPHVKATYLFAREFNIAYQRFFAETRDKETSKMIRGIHSPDVFKSRDKTSIHLARQAFDLLGVRYDFGLAFAMRRFLERGWRSMPRPNQLYGDELLADLADAWKSECKIRLQIPKNPYFLSENFEGSRIQCQYIEWLLGQINMRDNKHLSIGNAVYTSKVLPEPLALDNFGETILARAKKSAV